MGGFGDSNFVLSGDVVSFDYLFPLYQVDVVIKHKFIVPTSNVYSLDWIIDTTASQVYQSGSPIAASIGVGFHPMQSESSWRIQLHSNFSVVESLVADLLPVPGYWRPD